jgi:hypothetical protein
VSERLTTSQVYAKMRELAKQDPKIYVIMRQCDLGYCTLEEAMLEVILAYRKDSEDISRLARATLDARASSGRQ